MAEDVAAPAMSGRVTGALVGMAIGDALGLVGESPAADLPVAGYQPVRDAAGETVVEAGQFSAHTELALCLAESAISSGGFVDPVTAGYRFAQVLRSEHGHLVDPTSRAALERAVESGDYQDGLCEGGRVGPGPAARIAPVALVHALGRLNTELFVREVMRATLITHCDPLAVNGALALAYALTLTVRREVPRELLIAEVLAFIDEDDIARRLRVADELPIDAEADAVTAGVRVLNRDGSMADAVASALYLFSRLGDSFETATLAAANAGPESAAIGAMTGALAGAWVGGQTIPEPLVEGLDGRTYLLMASPALYRTAQRRGGLFLQLHKRA